MTKPKAANTTCFFARSRILNRFMATTGLALLVWLMSTAAAVGNTQEPPSASWVLQKLEKRYDCEGFSARFEQISTLKAMEITDTASGKAYFKRPGKMRWVYEKPNPQKIVTNGKKLWIYKPRENQVMVGKAPAIFGEGQGVNFLSGIKKFKKNYEFSLAQDRQQKNCYVLKLIPLKETLDLSAMYIYISKKDFKLAQIETVNPYDDTTIITFDNINLNRHFADDFFTFQIPVDADVVDLNHRN